MLIHKLKISGLLSFGPNGVDLPMEPLNVLIGPNGSGKSNLLEVLALLQHAPRELDEAIRRDGVWAWLWKGEGTPGEAGVEAIVHDPKDGLSVRHQMVFANYGEHFRVIDERIEYLEGNSSQQGPGVSYHLCGENHVFDGPSMPEAGADRALAPTCRDADEASQEDPDARTDSDLEVSSSDNVTVSDTLRTSVSQPRSNPGRSVLSEVRDAQRYPALNCLQEGYQDIRLFRDWAFGPSAALRRNPSAHDRTDFLVEGGTNLALVLSQFLGDEKRKLVAALQALYDGIVDINCPVAAGGGVALFLEERGGRQIPASRLSDGTLRYLSLLAILLHPEPPSLVCIEEPELGLHPDLLPALSDLLVEASARSQLVVTTHSDVLVDALTDHPESVVVCEQRDGQTEMRRLDKDRLAKWLKDYTLGDLWTSGELGGNRW